MNGDDLFKTVAKKGNGILLNNNGPTAPMFFDSQMCAEIASA
jgi:hypothetical protein